MSGKKYIEDKALQKKSRTIRILLVVFFVLVAALIGCGIFLYINMSQIWGGIDFSESDIEIAEEENTAGLPEVSYQEGSIVDMTKTDENIDIMLIGVDNRNSTKFTGLSDVMIYMRINTEDKSIKLVSFMRDMLVKIEGHDKNKLNTAYSYGGLDLMYQTYYENFGLEPDYYMVVNFFGMEDIINSLDGVDVNIESSEELEYVNMSIEEANDLDSGKDVAKLEKTGQQHLNGRQAVAYMRTRHPGGDAARIKRQQTVLYALFDKATDIGLNEISGLIGTLAEYVRTDIPLGTMIDLAKSVHGIQSSDLQTFRYPEEYQNGYYKGAGSIVQPEDFDTEYNKLYEFLNN